MAIGAKSDKIGLRAQFRVEIAQRLFALRPATRFNSLSVLSRDALVLIVFVQKEQLKKGDTLA